MFQVVKGLLQITRVLKMSDRPSSLQFTSKYNGEIELSSSELLLIFGGINSGDPHDPTGGNPQG